MKYIALTAGLFFLFSNVGFAQEEVENAYEKLDSLEKVLSSLPEDTSRLSILYDLTAECTYLLEDSLFKMYANQHLEIAKKFRHAPGLKVSYKEFTANYMYSYPTVFKERLKEGKSYFQENKDTLGLLQLIVDEGFYEGNNNHNYNRAIQLYEQAEVLNKKIKNPEIQELIYADLADFAKETNNSEVSLNYVNKVLQQDTFYSKDNKARVLWFKGDALLNLEQLDSVEFFLQASLKIFLEIGDFFHIQQLYGSLGDYYLAMEDMEQAKAYYKKTEPLAKLNDCACTPLTINYVNIGIYYYDLEQYDSARTYLKKSIKQALWEKDYNSMLIFYSNPAHLYMSEIYEKEGDFSMALQHYKKYQFLSDSLLKMDNNKALKELNIQYETKEKEQQITLLNKDNEILTARNQTYLAVGSSIGLLALFSIGFLLNLRRKNQQITQQKIALQQLNTTKDRLFAIISHDLRKPALAFRGISKKVKFLIQQQEFDTLDKYGASLEKAAYSLNNLLDNLLNWALKQRNVLPYQPIPLQVAELTTEVMELFDQMAADKNITFNLDIPNSTVAFADPNAYATIIRNLIDNALKYTPNGGMIEIVAQEQTTNVLLKITDSGVGIPAEKIAQLFDLQKHKSTQGTKGEMGAGLGLTLVKDLIALNKGTIHVQSKVNRGTTFEVLLPAA